MKSGNSWELLAVSASLAVGLAGTASAADLGGNCCADLEERIAELEATTARKGNRKVSLEIGGQVNQALMMWDDGVEDDTYGVTNDNSRTRFRFRGKAKINDDWQAGYALEVGVRSGRSNRFTQDDPEGLTTGGVFNSLDLRDSYWFLKSKTYGGLSVGFQGQASDTITESNLSQTKDFAKLSDMEDTGLGLFLRSSTTREHSTSLSYFRLLGDAGDQPGDGDRRQNAVKYETPEWNGFTVSSSYSNTEFYDVAVRYAGEFGGFKVLGGLAYGKEDGASTGVGCNANAADNGQDCTNFGGSVSVMHTDTGLFVSVGAGTKKDDLIKDTVLFSGAAGVDDRQDFWALQAGIERKWHPLGKTTVFGEYYDYEGGAIERRTIAAADVAINPFAGAGAAIRETGLEAYGFGVAQGIDAAAMVLYLHYRHVEADLAVQRITAGVATGPVTNVGLEDLDIVTAGGIIKF